MTQISEKKTKLTISQNSDLGKKFKKNKNQSHHCNNFYLTFLCGKIQNSI